MLPEKQKKAVAYLRISSLRQVDNESTATQRQTIQRYADENGIEIVEWFEDIAKSAKNADREGLQSLVKYCLTHRGKINYWIVYNMKRASRDIDSYSSQIRLVLRAKGVSVRSATEPGVNDTKEGRFLENLFVSIGQLDNEGKAEVTIDNMRSLAQQGYWQHPPVVGYSIHKIPNELGKLRPTLKPNAMAPKVIQVLERFSQGDVSKAELARFAADVGLRSRYDKKLSEDSINRLLKNSVYAGFVSDKFTEYENIGGQHEALISTETYEQNQSILYPKNSRKDEIHLQKNKAYPLKGLVLCMNCELPMYASAPKTGSGTHSPRYHCARTSCKGKVKSVKSATVHEDFEDLLKRIKPSEGILRLYKQVLIREASNALGGLNHRLTTTRKLLDEIDESKLKVVRKFTEETITIDEKNALTDSLDKQKLETSEELRELEQQQTIRETDIELAISIMENVDKQWSESALDVQLRFQSMLFPEGLLYDSINHRFGTNQISPLYRCMPIKKDAEAPLKSDLVDHRQAELLRQYLMLQ